MSNLSICIPSKRKLIDSKNSIESALHYINNSKNTEFHISDNSEDPAKKEYFDAIVNPNIHYKDSKGADAPLNWRNAISSASGDFIGILNDDDLLIKIDPTTSLDSSELVNCIGFRPNIAVWEKEKGIVRQTSFEIVGETALQRVQKYFQINQGNNNTIYSFMRKDILKDIHYLNFEANPTGGWYNDWAMVLGYVSSGNIFTDHSSLYIYDNHNWAGTSQEITARIESLFTGCGLIKRSIIFLPLFNAIDSFIFIGRKSTPISRQEALDAGIFALTLYLKSFIQSFQKNPDVFTEIEKNTIRILISSIGLREILNAVLEVINAHAPEATDKYRYFYTTALGCEWGYFI